MFAKLVLTTCYLVASVCAVNVPNRWKRQSLLSPSLPGQLGSSCQQNTDCINFLQFCSQGSCACTSSAIEFNNYCYQKFGPGSTGCQYDIQCNAVWPQSTCNTGTRACDCPTGYVPAQTRDGNVCAVNGACPLPNLATANLLTALSAGGLQTCTTTCGVAVGVSIATPVATNADIYDCVITTAGQAGKCCPSRAFTCSQSMATGGQTSGQLRYYYNSVTGTCNMFNYNSGGATAANTNANNFETLQHCKSYCMDFCARGNPQYNVAPEAAGSSAQLTQCSDASSGCGTGFECAKLGGGFSCCTGTDIICSLKGGRHTYSATLTVADVGFQGITNFLPEIRYYFNPASASCLAFSYLGSGGNFNNFKSMTDCTVFCQQQLCVLGSPLLTSNGVAQKCSSSSGCPTSYECTSGTGSTSVMLCCPTKQTICAQPQAVGNQCSSYSARFWHNPTTGTCEMFQYSGCGGNDNNFRDYDTCMSSCSGLGGEPKCVQGQAYKDTYGKFYQCNVGTGANPCPLNYECKYDGYIYGCCPVKTYTCALSLDSGRECGVRTSRWYFDSGSQTCTTMTYFGCDGNPNNFATKTLCESYCGSGGCPNGGTVYLEPGNSYPRVCSPAVTCPAGYECDPVTEGGNTQTKCCPTKAQVCQTSPSLGISCSSTSTKRFFYNRLTKLCQEFTFQGCELGGNNFGTLAQCNNFCGSAACLAGEVAFLDPNNNQARTCIQNQAGSCPSGFQCRYSSLNQQSICCGGSSQGVCSATERAYMDALTMEPRECLPSNPASCPSPFLCKLNTLKGKYYCCSSLDGSFCPAQNHARFDTVTRQPINCVVSLLQQSTCPLGYSCQSTTLGSYNGFCCSTGPLCANNIQFDKDLSGNARMCTPGFSGACRSGFSCQTTLPGSIQGICCQGNDPNAPVNGGCDGSQQAQLQNNQVVTCSAFGTGVGCTLPYTCQWSTQNNKYQCCGNVTTTGSCPTNYQPYLVNSQPLKCSSQANCPSNAQCLTNTVGQMQCCIYSTGPQCNSNQVSYQGQCLSKVVVGQPCVVAEQCLGSSLCLNRMCNCPSGLTLVNGVCQQTQPTTVICAGTNQPAYINPATQQPIFCQIGGANNCPLQNMCAQATTGQSVCCPSSTVPGSNCPAGQTVITQNGQALTCDNGQSFNCNPTGSSCSYSPSNRRFYCCRTGISPTPNPGSQGCAFGSPLMYTYTTPPMPLSCNPSPNNCPSQYTCQFSVLTSRNQCCPNSPMNKQMKR